MGIAHEKDREDPKRVGVFSRRCANRSTRLRRTIQASKGQFLSVGWVGPLGAFTRRLNEERALAFGGRARERRRRDALVTSTSTPGSIDMEV